MYRASAKNVLISLFLLACSAVAIAQNIPKAPKQLVTDFANVLSIEQAKVLENMLLACNGPNQGQFQLAILIQNGVKGELNSYCTKIINKWGIGFKGVDNGLLIFVDPKSRSTYLATGTGTQVWLPNNVAKHIVDDYMIPQFSQGKYYQGLFDAIEVIKDLATGKRTAKDFE